jgi:hypothetical protein
MILARLVFDPGTLILDPEQYCSGYDPGKIKFRFRPVPGTILVQQIFILAYTRYDPLQD